jgi:epoxyqueuosine reductase QueG
MKTDLNMLLSQIKTKAGELGAKAFGIADLEPLKKESPDLLNKVPGDYPLAIVLGIRLQKAALDDIVDRPTPLYFHHYRQTNYQLDRAAFVVADMIQDAGYRALAIPASQTISRAPMSGHVSHRHLGRAAGLGFIGRSNLLIHPRYRAQMRYVSILTDMPTEPNTPYEGDCGSCRACVEACPANAIKEDKQDFDLEACYEKLTEFTKIRFVGQHICGVCVKECGGDL